MLIDDHFGARVGAAVRSQARYDRHVAPVIAWAVAEWGDARTAMDALNRQRFDDDITPAGLAILEEATRVLSARTTTPRAPVDVDLLAGVREIEIATPAVADAPFTLSAPVSKAPDAVAVLLPGFDAPTEEP